MSTTMIGLDAIRQAPRRICRTIWETIPSPVRQTPLMFRAGRYIYRKFTRHTVRVQTHYTHFMRNPPLLAVLGELASNYPENSNIKVASIGCSTGAELYSVLYAMRMAHAKLNIVAHGVDISTAVVAVAKGGIYRPDVPAAEAGTYASGRAEVSSEDVPQLADIFDPLPDGALRVKDWLRQNTTWLTADATDDKLLDLIGTQHFLLANNFIGPMEDRLAERCIRNMMRLVASGGYLVMDGVDLDVKTKVLKDSGFQPVLINQSEIWASEAAKSGWPWLRWATEPLDRSEPDWPWRYSVVFRFEDH